MQTRYVVAVVRDGTKDDRFSLKIALFRRRETCFITRRKEITKKLFIERGAHGPCFSKSIYSFYAIHFLCTSRNGKNPTYFIFLKIRSHTRIPAIVRVLYSSYVTAAGAPYLKSRTRIILNVRKYRVRRTTDSLAFHTTIAIRPTAAIRYIRGSFRCWSV